ncbi:MAG: ECF transporter S component [Lachnospiraceae bacterium]|nr:ECF transporter S component [Lachnospiraceae bacterium]
MEKRAFTEKKSGTYRLVLTAFFVAIILLMAFTPLGYIPTPMIKISLISIPVAVGAIILGPVEGLILGTVFGLTSVYQSMAGDGLGPLMMQIAPIANIIVRLPTRMLMGFLTGVIYRAIKDSNIKAVSIPVACVCAPVLNTILYMTTLCLLFFNKPEIQDWAAAANLPTDNVIAFVTAMVGFNAFVEALAALIIGSAITKALMVAMRNSNMGQALNAQ